MLTDPLLRTRVAHLVRHAQPTAARVEEAEIVLVSHAHRDHLDYPSLRRLPRSAVVVVPQGLGRSITRLSFADVVELAEDESVELAGVRIRGTHADHAPGRGIVPGGARALGYLVTGSTTTYFAGDTDVFAGMAELGPVDLALLPVSGWGPSTPAGHLDPVRAAEAARLLRPRHAVPIHWGTFRPVYRTRAYDADARAPFEFARSAVELLPGLDVRVLAIDERWVVASSGTDDAPAPSEREGGRS